MQLSEESISFAQGPAELASYGAQAQASSTRAFDGAHAGLLRGPPRPTAARVLAVINHARYEVTVFEQDAKSITLHSPNLGRHLAEIR